MRVVEQQEGKKMRLDIEFDTTEQVAVFEGFLMEALKKMAATEGTVVGNIFGDPIDEVEQGNAVNLLPTLVSKFVDGGK